MNPKDTPEADSTHHSSSRWPSRLGKLILAAFSTLVVLSIAFPNACLQPDFKKARWASASQQAASLVNAIKLYETQYSVLPMTTESETPAPTDTKLVNILTGIDSDGNPKETAFLEGKEAKPARGKRPARSGFISHPDGSQSLVDPWGNHYMTICDTDDDGKLQIPHHKNPVEQKAVAWSYGEPPNKKDHKSALNNPPKKWLTTW